MFDGVSVPLLKINNNDPQNLRDNHIFHYRQMGHNPHKNSLKPPLFPQLKLKIPQSFIPYQSKMLHNPFGSFLKIFQIPHIARTP